MSAPDAEPQPIKHDFDWDALPPPWCEIGPQFRAECEAISSGADLPGLRMQRGSQMRGRRYPRPLEPKWRPF